MSAVIAAAVLWWFLRPFRVAVEGRSMAPTLQPGDFLVAVRAKRPRPGSFVVVEHPDRPGFELVKRLDRVPGADRAGPDGYWVVGDAPDASTDSRTFGPVPGSAIRGVVVARYWPPSRVAWLLDWAPGGVRSGRPGVRRAVRKRLNVWAVRRGG